MARFADAPEPRELGLKLINTVERHEPLQGMPIEFVFIDKAPTRNGRAVAGRARKLGGLSRWLIAQAHGETDGPFEAVLPMFVIEISHDIWQRLTDAQKVALVDHELCHCIVRVNDKGEVKPGVLGHDVEEFVDIVERHGLWSPQLAVMAKASAAACAGELDDLIAKTAEGPEVAG